MIINGLTISTGFTLVPPPAPPSGGGYLYLQGLNTNGQLGDNTIIHRSSPVQTIAGGSNWISVAAGPTATIAVKTDGTLWTWGTNAYGQLGDNTTIAKSSPIQTVAGGNNWTNVSAGTSYFAAIKTDGTLWTWGRNNNGQLGDDTTIHRSSPVQTLSGGTSWSKVSCGNYHMGAIKTDNTLWMWGQAAFGQLGDGQTGYRSSPNQSNPGTTWSSIAAGGSYTLAIRTNGTLWAWGYNYAGILGDNTTISKSSPVQTVASGSNWSKVSAGGVISAAIKTDGTLWTWGLGTSGELGNNTTINKSSPVQTVAGGTNWQQVSAGDKFCAAIKTDGTLWAWGLNTNGQLGDNTVIAKSSPVQTIASGTDWISLIQSNGVVAGGIKAT